jgi:hypothetical protein
MDKKLSIEEEKIENEYLEKSKMQHRIFQSIDDLICELIFTQKKRISYEEEEDFIHE